MIILIREFKFYGGYGMGYPPGPFEASYRAYPVSFIDKPHLENGDKVIMPPSALDRLASLHIDYPMLFEIQNPAVGRTSHCGVLEFVADEGLIYMPYWMMQNLLLEEGDVVKFKSATLPKGTYVKLQPHTKDFLDISNPKAVLETTLRNFSCLTVGDNIMVAYNNKKYYIDIVESKPAAAITIIETDCEVDFAPPLDYKEPERAPPRPAAPAAAAPAAGAAAAGASTSEAPAEPEEPKFQAFVGSGRRLDGKPSKLPASPAPVAGPSSAAASASTSRASGAAPASAAGAGAAAGGGGAPAAPGRPKAAGKLVFGSSSSRPASNGGAPEASKKDAQPKENKEEEKKDENKFQAFSGKRYSLRD
eukprot:jgi/Mesen1/8863/ME000053S08267